MYLIVAKPVDANKNQPHGTAVVIVTVKLPTSRLPAPLPQQNQTLTTAMAVTPMAMTTVVGMMLLKVKTATATLQTHTVPLIIGAGVSGSLVKYREKTPAYAVSSPGIYASPMMTVWEKCATTPAKYVVHAQ
ncbi:MAG: hypothetical protein OHK0052_23470 [Anaerolineales bacterium]